MKANKNTLWINNLILKIFFSVLLIYALIFFNSCSGDNEGFGPYYEGSFIDEISFSSKLDTVNVIIEQLGITPKIKEVIPYSVVDDLSLSDSIKLKLLVSFGSYSQNPKVVKEVNELGDSTFVWYSTINRYKKTFSKISRLLEVETSPEVQYVSIDSIVIYKAGDKFVNLFSRRIK